MSSSESTTSSDNESVLHENTTPTAEYKTPTKRRYKRTLHHGLTHKMARYFKVTPEKNQVHSKNLVSSEDFENDLQPQVHSFPETFSDISTEISTESLSSDDDTSSESSISDASSTGSNDLPDDQGSQDEGSFSELDSNDLPDDQGSDPPLYEGCKHSEKSAYTMIMLFAMQNSLSNEGFSNLLHLISSFLPESTKFTTSVYKLKEFLKFVIGFQEPILHYYCEECQQYSKDATMCKNTFCRRNNGKMMVFHDLDVPTQLKNLFKDSVFYNILKKYENKTAAARDDGSKLHDILDGAFYKNTMKRLQTGADLYLTFTLNTDGVSLFSSSKKGSLWPIYLAINELPVKLRFSRKYLLPCYLHCHVEKPNMFTYMQPLIDVFQILHNEGIEVDTPDGKLRVKAHLMAASLDLPARAIVSNMKQFNGKFSCCMCMDEGATPPGNPLNRFYPYQDNNVLRKKESFINDAKHATRDGVVVNGIKGPSSMLLLPYADPSKMFPIDWMHCVLLGVTKALMTFWLDAKHKNEDFFIGDKMSLLNKRLMRIKLPDFISRRQRGLQDHAHWKASECREWLIHYSTAVLLGLLPSVPYVHHLLLVTSMSYLTKYGVTSEELEETDKMLTVYCKMYPKIYGMKSQTMNVHLLRHLVDTVKLFGPLYGYSCFGFESMNSFLKSMVHGTGHVNSQVCFAVGMSKQITALVRQYTHGHLDDSLKFLVDLLSSKILKEDHHSRSDRVKPLGRRRPLDPTSCTFYDLITDDMLANDASVYGRVQIGEEVLYSKEYQNTKTRNSFSVCFRYQQRESFGSVISFVCANFTFAVVERFCTEPFRLPENIGQDITDNEMAGISNYCPHIVKITSRAAECILVPIEDILTKCVLLEVGGNETYISKPPNRLEHN